MPLGILQGLLFGAIVGFSLGLTGGGGSILAVPLLVYGLSMAPRVAVGTSLAAVGATALLGFAQKWRRGEVEVRVGLLFALAGVVGAPLGAAIGSRIPEALLLALFSGLMLVVAARMWVRARAEESARGEARDGLGPEGPHAVSPRGAAALAAVGLLTGVLSGLFGVGGGFVIVPALVFAGGVGIRRAIGTSLLVIALVSASGVASLLALGRPFDMGTTALFAAGGLAGTLAAGRLARRLSGPRLTRVFAVAVVLMAAFMIAKTLVTN